MYVAESIVTKADVRGTASGVMFMAFFGAVWADIGIGGLRVSGAIWLLIVAILIGTALFFSGIRMIRLSRHLPHTNQFRNASNVNKWFNIVFAAQFGLIAIAAMVTNVIGHFDWFFPVMAIIVGVHFFPLAHLFQVRAYYVTGTSLLLLAIATVILVPQEISIAGHTIDAWWTLIGLGSMLSLWITSFVMLNIGRKLLQIARYQ